MHPAQLEVVRANCLYN